jgi:hypothetical protein
MPNARSTDPETSREAADSVHEPTMVQQRIHDILETEAVVNDNWIGLTDDELYKAYKHSALVRGWVLPTPQSVRSRRNELVAAGRVVHSGSYGFTQSGRRSRKWTVA